MTLPATPPFPATPPPGFIFQDIAKSTKEAMSRASFSTAVEITKSAMVKYVMDHFSGQFSNFFRKIVPSADHFVTDADIDASDRMKIPLLILRKYPDFFARLPAILINNTGADPVPTSIAGGLEGGFWDDTNKIRVMRLTAIWDIPIDIVTAAQDSVTAAQLMESIVLCYTTLRTITQTSRIESGVPGHNWVITLPTQVGKVTGPADAPTEGDPTQKLFTYTISIKPRIESQVLVGYAHRPTMTTELTREFPAVSSGLPAQINLGTRIDPRLLHRPLGAYAISSDTRIAMVDADGFVVPKRKGTFHLLVLIDQPSPGSTTGPIEGPRVLLDQAVEVV